MTININEEKVFRIIEEKKPRIVLFNAPGGLLRQTRELMKKVEEKYNVRCMFVGDTCYGICDTTEYDAEKLGADVVFHIGHSAAFDAIGNYTYLIEANDDVKFDGVILKSASLLAKYKKIGLATFSQHMNELSNAKLLLERLGFEVFLGKGNNLLLPSQVFGCDFSTVYFLKDVVDAFFFLGESEFHAVGLALSTGKPTFMLDPYIDEVLDMEQAANERLKRATLSIYKALDAKKFGVITGLKEGQYMRHRTEWVTRKLEMLGREVFHIAMREITPERLAQYADIDAFIQTACPRISIDGYSFSKPVLSIPQADALIKILQGQEADRYLERPRWIELMASIKARKTSYE